MDMMIPFLGRISRLQLEPKGAFHIAGLKDANVQRLELEKRKKRETERKEKLLENATNQPQDKNNLNEEDDEPHLDTWA